MKKLLFSVFILILSTTLVLAAGGGGGGGSGGSGTSPYSDLKCSESGVLSFSRGVKLEPVTVKATDGTEISVPGTWDNGKFMSEEAVLVKAGSYTLSDPTYGLKTVECPGLVFSCKLADISLETCSIQDDILTAKFVLKEVSTDKIKLQFSQTAGKTLTYEQGSFSSELKGLKIQALSATEYQLSLDNTQIKTIQLSLPQCIGRYYKYSTIDCVPPNQQQMKEVVGEKLKCGGYLDIHDRVQCRLSLREQERQEYENFFPEECKTRQDQQHCLEIYQAVQECWDFPNGPARINCVQRVLKLGDILTEKANCNALDAGKRENCNQELREKLYALVKFRLYNLEEEAEKLMEQGLLTQEQVTDFVVNMEEYKSAFNGANTKEERQQIILQARQDWIALIRTIQKVEQ